jgi:hypothetical protein
LHLSLVGRLSDGVTGNTSDFGSEESRFEPWSDNFKRTTSAKGVVLFCLYSKCK